MTSTEAISYLGGDEDHVEEYVTQEVFELKTNLLKGTIVPQVMIKKAEKLALMADALVTLGFEDEHLDHLNTELLIRGNSADHLIHFFRKYEEYMSILKLKLMQAFHPRVVSQILLRLSELETQKFRLLYRTFSNFKAEDASKLSEHIDSGLIISELKSTALDNDVVSDLNSFPTLKKEINKSFKYCKFVDSKKE